MRTGGWLANCKCNKEFVKV
uniref:Uncharacterized protein n=1 Tax=Anguilla anguilla TaxID=7936 RepID=A0A0E9SJL9_ANGAN